MKAGGLVPPDTGGKIRSFHLLKQLARKHEITLFTFYAAHSHDVHGQLKQLFTRVISCPLSLPAPKSLLDYASYAHNLLSHFPYSVGKYYRREVTQRVRELVQTATFDVIVSDFLAAAPVIPWELPCPKILFTHNVETLIWKRHSDTSRNPLWKAVCWREYRTMARLERSYLRRADWVLAVSEHDRDFFAQYVTPTKISVVPTGVDVEYFRPAAGREQPDTLVYTGSMDWRPNEDAVFYFVKQMLPRIRLQVPRATFWIVGRLPSRRLQALAAENGAVRVTGAVEDIRPYVEQAGVYVVPLRVGSGTRLKIFEAMAMGKAVVSTTVGAEGLPVKHGENIILADEPQDFANSVVSVLRNPVLRSKLGEAARQLVEHMYSWSHVAVHLEDIFARIADMHPRHLAESGSADRLGKAIRV